MNAVRRRSWLGITLAIVGAVLVGCSSASSDRSRSVVAAPSLAVPQGAELTLTFDDVVGVGSVLPSTSSGGSEEATVSIITAAGGRVLVEDGPTGTAARFPAVSPTGVDAAAAVVVRPTGVTGGLTPGSRDFTFGADVAVDEFSESATDNGDNVLQRGLAEDESQYKLQVDHGRPSCRIAGGGVSALVEADLTMDRQQWYRIRCRRNGGMLSLTVSRWDGVTFVGSSTWQELSSVTEIDFAGADTPISVGAKVDEGVQIPRRASDQLNGAVDNVFVDVEGG